MKRLEFWDLKVESLTPSVTDLNSREVDILELNKILQCERNSLRQKSRIKWATEGDKNTKFFHGVVKQKYCNNNLKGLIKNGVWCESPSDVKDFVYSYFSRDSRSPVRTAQDYAAPYFVDCLRQMHPI